MVTYEQTCLCNEVIPSKLRFNSIKLPYDDLKKASFKYENFSI